MNERRDALIKLTDLYENTSKAGNRYYVGYLGGVKLVMLPRKDAKEGEPQWSLFIAERQQKATAASNDSR